MLAAKEDAADVDGHDRVPRVDVGVDDRMVRLRHDPGVVVEDIEPAVGGHRVVDHALRVGLARHVGPDVRRLAAGLLDDAHRFVAGGFAELGDDDLGTFPGEDSGCHPAHPATAAGDDRDLAIESHDQALLRSQS